MTNIKDFITKNIIIINYGLHAFAGLVCILSAILSFSNKNYPAGMWAIATLCWIMTAAYASYVSESWRRLAKDSLKGWDNSLKLLGKLLKEVKPASEKVADIDIASDDESLKKSVPLPENVKPEEAF